MLFYVVLPCLLFWMFVVLILLSRYTVYYLLFTVYDAFFSICHVRFPYELSIYDSLTCITPTISYLIFALCYVTMILSNVENYIFNYWNRWQSTNSYVLVDLFWYRRSTIVLLAIIIVNVTMARLSPNRPGSVGSNRPSPARPGSHA